jgi:hypothetical protein
MFANIVDLGACKLVSGMGLEVTFEPRRDVTLPQFRPAIPDVQEDEETMISDLKERAVG